MAGSITMLDEVFTAPLQAATDVPIIETTDAAMVRAVLAGDEGSFALIFDKYKRYVAVLVGRFFKERADVEEAVQQSFVKAYFSLKSFNGTDDRSFAAWLTRITVNVCYDEFRRRQRKAVTLFSEVPETDGEQIDRITDREIPADRALASAQLADKVLAGLDVRDRIALTLVYSADLSIEEAAEAVGMTANNLKTRLFRCRNHIRQRFSHLF